MSQETTRSGSEAPAPPTLAIPVPVPAEPPAPAIADGLMHPLDPRYVGLNRLIGRIFSAVVAPALLATPPLGGWVGGLPVRAVVPLAALAAVLAALIVWFFDRWPAIEYRHLAYRLDRLGLEIRQGVVWRRVVSVPRSRVQHTDVSQGPLERRFGLATLSVHTAGTEEAKVDLPGLDHATALAIRDHLVAPGGGDDAV